MNSLCAAVEEVEIPELEADPLAGVADELVVAVDVLGVGAWEGGGGGVTLGYVPG